MRILPAIIGLCLITTPAHAADDKAKGTEGEKLRTIVTKYTESAKRLDAYYAPMFNVEEDLNKFGDYLSADQRKRGREIQQTGLSSLKEIDKAKLSPKDQVLYNLFRDDLELGVKYFDTQLYLIDSFTQMDNRLRSYIDDSSPELTSFPFDSTKHYRDYLKRSEGFAPFVDRQIDIMNEGLKKGYALNCIIAKNAINTYQDALESNVEKNPFYRPVLSFPKSVSKKEQEELRTEFQTMVKERILPAFTKFDQYYRKEYMPKCRKSYGVAAMPKGKEMYAYSIRKNTDMNVSAQTLHKTGLAEVARLKGELAKVQKQLGYKGSLASFLKALNGNKDNYFKSAPEMFNAFLAYQKKVDAEIPKYFSLIPKSGFKILESENSEDAAGRYVSPTDFQPFGRFIVNTKSLTSVPTFEAETLYLHEAIPGHHFQLALQFEMKDQLTEYQRKLFNSTAFVEGWALYAERLGRESGWISSPLTMAGSLSDEMLRAVRLVVDTGIHSMGWSRQRTIQYMKDHLPATDRQIQIEADRYSVWPGQALAYKTGQMKILELREFARKKLGDKFDIREFHRIVLENGSVSLSVLETVVKDWAKQVPDSNRVGMSN